MTQKEFKNLFEYYKFTKKDEKQYPVVSKILKSLTPERIKKEIEAVQKVELPPDLEKWVKEYEKVGERNPIIWLLMYKTIETISFPIVSGEYNKTLQNTKFLLMMFNILLDDVVDEVQNRRLAEEIQKIPFEADRINFNFFSGKEKEYLIFSIEVWGTLFDSIKQCPRYEGSKDLFRFDILQVLNSMKFVCLINENPYLINETEYSMYFPCSILGMVYTTLNLMCSPGFDIQELGIIRRITWEAQDMVRIGNWVGTWEREIQGKDYTSGIFAYLVDSNILTIDKLVKKNSIEIIKRIKESQIEGHFLKEWEKHYKKVKNLGTKAKSLNAQNLLFQLEKVMVLHLSIKNI